MRVRRFDNADEASRSAAAFVAGCAERAIGERGIFTLALSGGSTPWKMLQVLAARALPWRNVHVFQVDERQAPEGASDRNLTHIQAQFTGPAGIPPGNVHAMPVDANPLDAGAARYGEELSALGGHPAVLDLVHLGLGDDGHTASLLPGDRLLNEESRDVGVTRPYLGRSRMTLTLPAINRARAVLWLILGSGKGTMLERLLTGDETIPAGRVSRRQAVIFTDVPG